MRGWEPCSDTNSAKSDSDSCLNVTSVDALLGSRELSLSETTSSTLGLRVKISGDTNGALPVLKGARRALDSSALWVFLEEVCVSIDLHTLSFPVSDSVGDSEKLRRLHEEHINCVRKTLEELVGPIGSASGSDDESTRVPINSNMLLAHVGGWRSTRAKRKTGRCDGSVNTSDSGDDELSFCFVESLLILRDPKSLGLAASSTAAKLRSAFSQLYRENQAKLQNNRFLLDSNNGVKTVFGRKYPSVTFDSLSD